MHTPPNGDLRWREACAPVHVADEIGLLGPDAHVCSRPLHRDTIAGGCGAERANSVTGARLKTFLLFAGKMQAK
jgi:hypothetical protein